jgi:hypothetical protein
MKRLPPAWTEWVSVQAELFVAAVEEEPRQEFLLGYVNETRDQQRLAGCAA